MRKQKIIKVGNSLAVTLPAEFVKEANIQAGEEFVVECNPSHKTVYMTQPKAKHNPKLTPEFYDWLDEISTKYKDAIKELANT
jgi:putative addiction module antidote